jgi:hypothetical protein
VYKWLYPLVIHGLEEKRSITRSNPTTFWVKKEREAEEE